MDSIPADRKARLLRDGDRLVRGPGSQLTRSEWGQVVAALFPGGRDAPRAEARKLLEAIPKSWLKDRSNETPHRYRQLWATYQEIEKKKLSSAELRFLVGWMGRMIRIRDEENKGKKKAEGNGGQRGRP